MYSFSRQIHLRQPTNITNEIVTAAFQLFKDNYKWEHPIRSLGIRAADLVLDDIPVQLDLFGNQEKKEKLEKLDRTVDEIRRRFGYFSIQRAAMYQDKVLSHLDAGTHTIHPHSYFHWVIGGIDLKKVLTRKQKESYQCILNYTKEHGYPPTVREFGKLIGVRSTSSAFSRIKQLEQNGYIRRIPASPRAIEIL